SNPPGPGGEVTRLPCDSPDASPDDSRAGFSGALRPPREETVAAVPTKFFDEDLVAELDQLRADGLYRQLRCIDGPPGPRVVWEGRSLLNFSSNDYLGLATHPAVKDAAVRAVTEFGAGSTAARLICGSLAPHQQLEDELARFKGTEAALSFGTGYATAIGTLAALLGKEDVLIVDKQIHACFVDGARMCGARLRVFRHNDPRDLEAKLRWASQAPRRSAGARGRRPRILIATESVFSMDGDLAPLREIVELKDRYGAWLMLDEAHGTGVFGRNGRGVAEHFGVDDRVEITLGTLSKAIGCIGGFIAGSRTLIDYLQN